MPGEILVVRAAHVLPVGTPPVRDGAVAIEDHRIVAVGPAAMVQATVSQRVSAGRVGGSPTLRDLGSVALLPGLVNSHTHLELSWLSGRVPPASTLPAWVRTLLAARRAAGGDDAAAVGPALRRAREAGTVAVGDIGNGTSAYASLTEAVFDAVAFYEIIGFAPENPDRLVDAAVAEIEALPSSPTVRPALAAHAPYSVHPDTLRRLGRERQERGRRPMSVHLGESGDEGEFLASGTGAWRALLGELGTWNPSWTAPATTPAAYLEALGFLGPGVLAVHGVHLGDGDLERLARLDVTLVTCPRSNLWTGVGAPPIDRFYASGVKVAVGTDSLASNTDLSVFAELETLRRLSRDVPASRLIESATLRGAEALGLGAELGSIAPGRRAALVAVDVPPSTVDVEEYLVGGIAPDRIRWVTSPESWRLDRPC